MSDAKQFVDQIITEKGNNAYRFSDMEQNIIYMTRLLLASPSKEKLIQFIKSNNNVVDVYTDHPFVMSLRAALPINWFDRITSVSLSLLDVQKSYDVLRIEFFHFCDNTYPAVVVFVDLVDNVSEKHITLNYMQNVKNIGLWEHYETLEELMLYIDGYRHTADSTF